MRMIKQLNVAVVAAAILAGGLATAQATLINLSVTNSSFEDPVIGAPDGFTSGAPTGWLGAGQIGVFQPVTPLGSYNVPIPDGAQVGYVHQTGWLYQVTNHQLVGGGTYTLEVQVGNRTELPTGNYRLILSLEDPAHPGNTGFAAALVGAVNPVATVDGAFVDASVAYVAPADLGAFAGRNLIIFLEHTVSGESAVEQINFDDVRFTLQTVDPPNGGTIPEPATLGLFGIGLAAFGLSRRRRRA